VFGFTGPAKATTETYAGYLFAYFKTDCECLFYATSDDGLHWSALNNGQPVLNATIGNKSIRDPYIIRKQDGGFQLLSTNSWESRSILLWDSNNLINWTNERLAEITPSNANNAWAPQAIYNPASNNYMVYWSTRTDGNWHHRIYKSFTTDFQTFSAPEVMYDPGYTVIDADIVPKPDGTYVMIFKDERDGYKQMYSVTSNSVSGPYSNMTGPITPSGTEGPTTFKLNDQQKWVMYYDFYSDGHFGASHSTELANWTAYGSGDFQVPTGARHNSVLPITQAEMDALKAQYPTTVTRWESARHPGYFARHYNYVGRIDAEPISPIEDSQFVMKPGLADPNAVSFESINFPGYYLRHSSFEIKLNADDGSQAFKEDATFYKVAGLSDSTKVSFKSYNYPTRYIRQSNFILKVEAITNNNNAKKDATFIQR